MQKALTGFVRASLLIAVISVSLFSCKSKISDADIEAKIQSISSLSGFVISSKEGVVTVSGEAKDDTEKANAESAIKAVPGVNQVVNNISIAAPPPPPAPVVISGDDQLNKGIADILKDFPTVKATAKDSIITVTGESSAANWKKIKIGLDGLKPKKVDAKGLKIK